MGPLRGSLFFNLRRLYECARTRVREIQPRGQAAFVAAICFPIKGESPIWRGSLKKTDSREQACGGTELSAGTKSSEVQIVGLEKLSGVSY